MKARKGRRMVAHKSHGSPRSAAQKGIGPVAGAGELVTPHGGPGAAAKRIMGLPKNDYPSAPASGAPPSGMSVYREE